jgi:hypothetical protein
MKTVNLALYGAIVVMCSMIVFCGIGFLIGLSFKQSITMLMFGWFVYIISTKYLPRQDSSEEIQERIDFMQNGQADDQ